MEGTHRNWPRGQVCTESFAPEAEWKRAVALAVGLLKPASVNPHQMLAGKRKKTRVSLCRVGNAMESKSESIPDRKAHTVQCREVFVFV